MKKATDSEIIEEICNKQDEIISGISRESIDVYLWLKDEYGKGNIIDNTVFQFVFRSYYRLDSAGLSDEQKAVYFKLLAKKEIDLEKILNNLYELPTLRNRNAVQFSFATKLIHTVDNSKPIFDTEVSAVINWVVSGNNKETKIKSAKNIFVYLEELYSKLDENEKVQETIKKFRTKFGINIKDMTDQKVLDFLIWSLGKLKKKR